MPVSDQRRDFERWAADSGRSTAKDSRGDYLVRSMREAWEVWRAACERCCKCNEGGQHA